MSRRQFLLFFLALLLVYLNGLGTIPLLEPDEGRYAEIPREMLVSGDFVTPRLNGVAYLEKPPLFYWGNAVSLALFGENEFGARFFTAAVSVAGALLTYWMGSVLSGPRTGLFSAIVLSTSLYGFVIGRLNTIDMTVAVALFLAIFPAYLYCSGRRNSRGWLHLSYAGAALSFLAKGLIGVVFPAAILLTWFAVSRRHREIGKAISWPGLLLFLAIALPWVVLVQARNPDFLWFFFVHEQFLRFTTTIHHRDAPFWFFVPVVFGGFIPWIAFLRRAILGARRAAEPYFDRDDLLFLWSWVLFIFLFFSFSKSKLPTYVSPIFPPLAVLFGRALDQWAETEDGAARCRSPLALAALIAAAVVAAPHVVRHARVETSDWTLLAAAPVILILLWGAVPLFLRRLGAERVVLVSFLLLGLFLTSLSAPAAELLGDYKSVKDLSRALSASLRPGDVVAQYGEYRQGIPFYTKRRNVLVEQVGELEYGMLRAPDRAQYFLSDAEFFRLWNSETRVLCYFKRDQYPLIERKFPNHRLLYRSGEGILAVNR